MRPLILAFSFIRVPKLFVSLLFWPMVMGVFLALLQAIVSSAYMGLVSETPKQFEQRIHSESSEHRWLRSLLYGTGAALPPIQVCRWHTENGLEQPPAENCTLEANDVVVRSDNPSTYDIQTFAEFFNGTTYRIHVCRTCRTNIVIEDGPDGRTSDVRGLRALGVYILTDAEVTNRVGDHYVAAKTALSSLSTSVCVSGS